MFVHRSVASVSAAMAAVVGAVLSAPAEFDIQCI